MLWSDKRRSNINVYHRNQRKKDTPFYYFLLHFIEKLSGCRSSQWKTAERKKCIYIGVGIVNAVSSTLGIVRVHGHVKGISVSILPLLFRMFILQAKVTKILLDYLPSYLRIKAIFFLEPLLCQVRKTLGCIRAYRGDSVCLSTGTHIYVFLKSAGKN